MQQRREWLSPVLSSTFFSLIIAYQDDKSMTKLVGNVHVPVMPTEYTQDTHPNNEFGEQTYENNVEYEREVLYVLGNGILAFVANILGRGYCVLLLGCQSLVCLER